MPDIVLTLYPDQKTQHIASLRDSAGFYQQEGDNMKKRTVMLLALAMVLCGCGTANNAADSTQTAAPTTAASTTEASTENDEKTATITTIVAEEETAASDEEATADAETAADEEESTTEAADGGASLIPGDLFAGYYKDENSSATMSIDNINDETYKVSITAKKTDLEAETWYFEGSFNGRQVLSYENCVKSTLSIKDDGSLNTVQEYTDGTGYLQISEEGTKTGIVWNDYKENSGSGAFFVKK